MLYIQTPCLDGERVPKCSGRLTSVLTLHCLFSTAHRPAVGPRGFPSCLLCHVRNLIDSASSCSKRLHYQDAGIRSPASCQYFHLRVELTRLPGFKFSDPLTARVSSRLLRLSSSLVEAEVIVDSNIEHCGYFRLSLQSQDAQ